MSGDKVLSNTIKEAVDVDVKLKMPTFFPLSDRGLAPNVDDKSLAHR